MIKLFLFFSFFFFQVSLSQEIQITVLDSLNQVPISEAIALNSEGQFITKADSDGVLYMNTNVGSTFYIVANGYEQVLFSTDNGTSFVCKMKKNPELLNEIVVGKKRTKIKYGNYNNHNNIFTDSQSCSSKYNYLVCATKVQVSKSSQVVVYNFCVSSKINNSPFNFQIYDDKDGLPNKVVYTQYIKDYKKGWNRTEISDGSLILDSGVYYIAMQWLPAKDKSDVRFIEDNEGKKRVFVGQSIVLNRGDGTQNSFMYKYDAWEPMYMKQGSYAHYIEAAIE